MVEQIVRPITKLSDCKKVLYELKNGSDYGLRNYLMFKIAMNTALRVSDLVNLKYEDVYTPEGHVRKSLHINEIKTGKVKKWLLIHVQNDLREYKLWLDKFKAGQPDYIKQTIKSSEKITVGTGRNKKCVKKYDDWLFPSSKNPYTHISIKMFYKTMKKVSQKTRVNHLGTHTPRKTGAYLMYRGNFDDVIENSHGKITPNNNIALAMKILNQSSEKMTLDYLGLEQESINEQLKNNQSFNISI